MCYTTHNYYNIYQNLMVQDIRNRAFKIMLSGFLVSIAPQFEQRKMETACDMVFAFIDMAKPPQTQENKLLVFGTNAYNFIKY